MKRRPRTQITVWPAITDLMTTIVVMAILAGVVGYSYIQQEDRELLRLPAARDHVLGEIDALLRESNMGVEVRKEEGVIRLSDDAINFSLGGETPISRHEANVGWLARALAEVVPCYISPDNTSAGQGGIDAKIVRPSYCQPLTVKNSADSCENEFPWLLGTILIEGHTDTVAVGDRRRFKNNLELSSMRAASVYEMIIACEPTIKEMRNTQNVPVFSTSGYGEMRLARPDDPGSDDNRRIDLRLLLEPKPDGN